MNSLFNSALKQSTSIRRDLDALAEDPATSSPALQGQISTSLTSLSRTIDDYAAMAKNELNPTKQDKAHERLKSFRAELSDYRQSFQGLKSAREGAHQTTTQNHSEVFTRRPHHTSTPENPYSASVSQSQSSLPSSSPLYSTDGGQPQYRNAAGQLSFGASPEDYSRESHALREQSFMAQTNSQLDEYLERGRAVLGDLGEQREMLKGTQKRLYGVANTLGVSGETIRMVERELERLALKSSTRRHANPKVLHLNTDVLEIDHNFSRAHRIVTTSILPVVEQYAQHSSAVWEGSKFWKQFFEASANVSLSSYEEPPEGVDQEPTNTELGADESQDPSTQFTPSSSSYASPSQDEDQTATPEPRSYRPSSRQEEEESTLLTPRAKPPAQPSFSSPYESLKRTVNPFSHTDEPSTSTLPSTPRAQRGSPTPDSSPFAPRPPASTARTPANDVLLHRVLDKNWRLQATPHAQPKLPTRAFSSVRKGGAVPTETPQPGAREPEEDELDDSSPFVPAPELHAEIFESPLRRTRVPGVSLLTPAKGKGGTNPNAEREGAIGGGRRKEKDIWDSDSDDEGGLEEGMSPPKTMQFHVPRERLLRTPAREASKRIVEDLLQSAGGNVTDDLDEDSPSVVRRTQAMDEDTF